MTLLHFSCLLLLALEGTAQAAALDVGVNEITNATDIKDGTTFASICYTYEEALEFCNDNLSLQARSSVDVDPKDVTPLLDAWAERNRNKSIAASDWRQGPMRDRNRYLLKEQQFTDCTFIVGPDVKPQTIYAHKFILQRASSLFEAIFNASGDRPIRISDVTPVVFTALLEFLYTGEVCIDDFDQICELAIVAGRFDIPTLAQRCRAFLWTSLYPHNVWRTYQCATRANDTTLQNIALQVAQLRTDEAMMDPSFTEITQEALIAFLKQEKLNVKTEVQLLDASVRWALLEVTKRDLPQQPESLRKVLGPALEFIRFLTLSPKEFADNQLTSQVLTCNERLAILYNLVSPGVLPLPDGISVENKTRKLSGGASYIDVVISTSTVCKNDTIPITKNMIVQKNTFDLFSTNIKSISSNKNVRGVNIPTQVKVKPDGTIDSSSGSYIENITIFITNSKNMIQTVTQYQGTAMYNSLLHVRFSENFLLQSCNSVSNCQQFRVRFGVSGRYPTIYTAKGIQAAGTIKNEHVNLYGYTSVLYLGEEFIYNAIVS